MVKLTFAAVAVSVGDAADHDLTTAQTVGGVRRSQPRLLVYVRRLDHLHYVIRQRCVILDESSTQ